jgi:hypothetical protein
MLSRAQLDCLQDTPTVRIGQWRKVFMDQHRDALPLPTELDRSDSGDAGCVIAVVAPRNLRLFYRTGMPLRARPLEPGTPIRTIDEIEVKGLRAATISNRSLVRRPRT